MRSEPLYIWSRWLADEFRAAGLEVVEVDGWRNRGRPASTGHHDPRGIIVDHHNGALSSASNPRPGLRTLIEGRSDLAGPLCQYAIDWFGVVIVIAAGRANVNGKKRAVPNWPEPDGNTQMGVEVMTNGTQALSPMQIRSLAISNAVVLRHFERSPHGWLYRHEDISLSGKWDLGSRTTAQLRADVDAVPTAPPTNPTPSKENTVAAVIDANGATLLFTIGLDGKIAQKIYDPERGWSEWLLGIPGVWSKGLSATVDGNGQVSIFGVGPDGQVWQTWSSPDGWHDPISFPGVISA